MVLSMAQIRAARGLLQWTQNDLSDRTAISAASIGAMETHQSTPRLSNLQKIKQVFEDAGVEFFEPDGVRRRSSDVRTYQGLQGYFDWFDDVYKTLESCNVSNREICTLNVDEKKFVKLHGKEADSHVQRVSNIENLKYKVIVKEQDNFLAFANKPNTKYRSLPKANFSPVPFYIYGHKMAIILLDAEPQIISIDNMAITEAYRKQFDYIWNTSKEVVLDEIKVYE